MKIKDLKKILDKANINPNDYIINGDGYRFSDVIVFIDKTPVGKYEVYLTERDKLEEKYIFDDENDACMYFLSYFISTRNNNLCEYFKKGKKYNVPEWVQEKINKYGSDKEGIV